jgi:hypothetical protein
VRSPHMRVDIERGAAGLNLRAGGYDQGAKSVGSPRLWERSRRPSPRQIELLRLAFRTGRTARAPQCRNYPVSRLYWSACSFEAIALALGSMHYERASRFTRSKLEGSAASATLRSDCH